MPVMDEFREEREALKHGTPQQKFSYFMDYYKWHVIIGVAAVIFVVTTIYQIATQKDTAFYAALVNGLDLENAESYGQSFAEFAGIDTESYSVQFDTTLRIQLNSYDESSVASSQKMAALIASKDIDVLVSDIDIINQYAYNDTFLDLRDFLTEEQFAAYEPYFYYMDLAVYTEKEAAFSSGNFEYVTEYPDPRKPETMEEPVPVGIYLDTAAGLKENYYYSGDVVIGVVGNTTRPETASKFIDFAMEQ